MLRSKLMGRIIVWLAILLSLGALVVFVFIPLFDTSGEANQVFIPIYGYEAGPEGYSLENDVLHFQLDPETTLFTVTDKRSGTVWQAVPPEADGDSLALGTEKDRLKSIFTLSYSTTNGVTTNLNSFAHSVKNQVYQISQAGDAIRVDYSLGEISRTFCIPQAITETRMNGYLENMAKSDSKQITEYYRKVNIDKLRSTDNKEDLLASYPDLAAEPVYVLRDNTADYIKERVESLLEKAGYTQADYAYDQSRISITGTVATAVFNVPLVYRLEGDDLTVEVLVSEIAYLPQYPVTKLGLLPSFGAGGVDDTGYMLVPDGTGGIIAFNNGKLSQNPYNANIYGWDWGSLRTQVVHETRGTFPAFGMGKNGKAFLCLLEEGSSFAGVNADVSGRYNSYNTVGANYTILHGDPYDVSERSTESVYLYEQALPEGTLRQRYRFLDTDDYNHMAQAYRAYLLQTYPALSRKQTHGVPTVVEILGAIDSVQHQWGVPVDRPLALTTYAQAQTMIQQLKAAGFDNLSVRLSGWMNGGVKQKILNQVKLVSDLGSREDLLALTAYTKANGVDLYLDGITHTALDSGILEGFWVYRDAAQHTTREKVELYPYSTVWYGPQLWLDHYYLLKPALIQRMTHNLGQAALDYGAAGVSLADTGSLLSADYAPKDRVTREESLHLQIQSLSELGELGLKVMIRQGNAYALPTVDVITDLDLEGAAYSIIDAYVPFYPMALHGRVDYTGVALNLAGDYEQALLQSAEMGAGLCFTFMQADAMALQETLYSHYYGADLRRNMAVATQIVGQYQEAMGPVFGQAMAGHERRGDVAITTYEDGTRVYVNYGYEAIGVDGVNVPARSYLAKEGTP